ncbi:endo alpha-1,4 polygalactosaminidase [Streptomyces lichenis]|uniref:Endo alpha-1,4 polygalactosaminidase n=1 Tax=Streptomyces lichenis TaxID=2306967 RepID=A0ABT0IHK4_9ACTN|nr:endo alpha-1,4 polygalactosaminidase [Streptomyces lichenis]MCK8680804.1 endo alpha-1,4 polygalactosaminidase [Streptomyces lichenis]
MNRTSGALAPLAALLTVLALLALPGCSSPAPAPSPSPSASASSPSASSPSTSAPASPSPSRSPSPSSSASSPSPSRSSSGPSKPARARWQPKPGTPWQWQLDGRVDPSVDVPVYDIDAFANTAEDVARLHRDGRRVICYVNAGAWEEFRPDAGDFPESLRGEGNGWPGERWLDIRRLDVLKPLMERRLDLCRDKGFDAVEPDLVDGYLHDTGFPLTAGHQLAYNRMLADAAHARGLAIGLKNDLPQIPQLVGLYDFAVNEECAQYDECTALTPFIRAGKAVFHVEYALKNDDFCGEARALGLSSMRKRLDLDPWRKPC